jgi:hypothetical protein
MRDGLAEMRASRELGVYVDRVVITAKIGKAIKIFLRKAAFKRFNMSLFNLHSVSDDPKRAVSDYL